MKNIKNDIFATCVELLHTAEISLTPDKMERLREFHALIATWNEFASLVSRPALESLEREHIADALSLAPWLKQAGNPGGLLDIGSGGGFPAIPLKILLPEMSLTLVERSSKKVGFLRKVTGALELKDVHILHGEFPVLGPPMPPAVITARAVEKPAKVLKAVLEYMEHLPEFVVFLCQFGTLELTPAQSDLFHVEPVDDAWTRAGLRRGVLHRIWKRTR